MEEQLSDIDLAMNSIKEQLLLDLTKSVVTSKEDSINFKDSENFTF